VVSDRRLPNVVPASPRKGILILKTASLEGSNGGSYQHLKPLPDSFEGSLGPDRRSWAAGSSALGEKIFNSLKGKLFLLEPLGPRSYHKLFHVHGAPKRLSLTEGSPGFDGGEHKV